MFKYIYGREIYISGYHKIGTDELLDDLIKFSGVEKSGVLNSKNAISIIGKPNSGKSTLFNAFLEIRKDQSFQTYQEQQEIQLSEEVTF